MEILDFFKFFKKLNSSYINTNKSLEEPVNICQPVLTSEINSDSILNSEITQEKNRNGYKQSKGQQITTWR